MSIKSWKQEFYPVDSSDACDSDIQAIEHSILKWSGTNPKALIKHDVYLREAVIRDCNSTCTFGFTTHNCALCHRVNGDCNECSIYLATGATCSKAAQPKDRSVWDFYIEDDNPIPMCELLADTKEWLNSQKGASDGQL